jgi:hypothetical protein
MLARFCFCGSVRALAGWATPVHSSTRAAISFRVIFESAGMPIQSGIAARRIAGDSCNSIDRRRADRRGIRSVASAPPIAPLFNMAPS